VTPTPGADTTVVVLSRSPGHWLEPCLRSVVGQADQVIVVDNGSPGATASAIGRRLGALVLPSAINLGFAGGVNLALARVTTGNVALLNDDAVAGPGWLERAASVLEAPDVAAVTPKIRMAGWYREVLLDDPVLHVMDDRRRLGRRVESVRSGGEEVLDIVVGAGIYSPELDPGEPVPYWRWTAPGRPFYVPVADAGTEVLVNGEAVPPGPTCRLLNKAGSYLRPDGQLGDHGAGSPDDGRWDRPAERFFASGTAMVARTETFRRLGGLADPFFSYYEDGDWSWRARLAGMRILYDPDAVVDHRVSATSGGAETSWVQRLAARNRVLCLVRNAPRGVALAAVRHRWNEGPGDGVRRDVMTRLPWAMASRRRLSRHWAVPPADVWNAWAGVDVTWDDGPVRTAAAGRPA
jgi:N-acetylglucosaminyl-diphospho-decaprenol L-rhamnosyltransferase